ncbi:2-oxo-4-hydroxy-4-carboxy-5-ureidoimidazoline decarboxylase [uncultured Streptomyces sp.]|uniref:2-oxo-4-hydroxy-4-carboxy-5-ureidoimidazoline decarboxylase n=1 Tax=uncultured Streptomyces sp. TaxID=174707 RepID=UPI0026192DE0|nr:2-oxo-4-hydroxy-4-carboxy-5-ureidoimidazoline decarboxylase [uncultured Streptomyces sp.]
MQHRGPATPGLALPRSADGVARFNALPRPEAEAALRECCGSRRWARRIVDHRPYPDLDAMLAAADEAGYDLPAPDMAEALADETAPCLHHDAPRAAHLALRAAHAAYESTFGHAFVICLDAVPPSQHVDQVLATIRARMENDEDEERAVTADEMRRLARARIVEMVTEQARRPDPV